MKFKLNNKYVRWGATAFLVVASAILFYYLIFHLDNVLRNFNSFFYVLRPVVFGLVIAYLLTPIVNIIEARVLVPLCNKLKFKDTKKRKHLLRAISILITTVVVIYSIYALIGMMVSQIVPSVINIADNFNGYINNFSIWINQLLEDNSEIRDVVIPMVNKLSVDLEEFMQDTAQLMSRSTEILKTVSLSVFGFLKFLWNFIIGFVIAIYVLSSKEIFCGQINKVIYAIFTRKFANFIIDGLHFAHKTFSGFISGKVLDSIIIGILCFIGTTLLGTPYAALVSLVIGVTNVIPFFGPYFGAIPSALLVLLVDLNHPINCVYFLIFILILQQVDGNFIGPKILGESTGLPGFWVIFSITVFGGLFGVIGMIIGVPIFAIIYAAIKTFTNYKLIKKSMPTTSNTYQNISEISDNGTFTYQKKVMGEEASTDTNENNVEDDDIDKNQHS